MQGQKEQLVKEIFYAGKPFEKQVKLLISVKRMLLTGEQFGTINIELYNKKIRQFDRILRISGEEKKSV